MRAGEDPWDEPLMPPATLRRTILLISEEDVDKGGTVLPASADTKVESDWLTYETMGTVLPETSEAGCALPV